METIEPNPGPTTRRGWRRRNKDEEKLERKRMKRRQKRERRREERARTVEREREDIVRIVTWNVQGLSLRENNRRRLRRVLAMIEKNEWEIVLLSELRAESKGILWFGEEGRETAVVHSERTAVVLRGRMMERWREERQRRSFSERTTTVVIGKLRCIAVYQPVWSEGREGIERYRERLEAEIVRCEGKETLVIGGDHNAQVGEGEELEGVRGRYGLRDNTNEAGEDLVEWCQENGLALANTFSSHNRRGTWFNVPRARWYELDGFLVKKDQRHKVMRGVRVLEETGMSDHKPVMIKIKSKVKKWRVAKETRVPNIRYEKLKEDYAKQEFKRRVTEKWERREEQMREDSTNWKMMSEVLTEAAEETCGRKTRQVANPWTIGHEEELAYLNLQISSWVDERNRISERMRTRAGTLRWQEQMNEARRRLKEARREMKLRLRELERTWWDEIIQRCEEASQRGDIGGMYSALRNLGDRNKKAAEGHNITTADFKEHFKQVSQDRYERREDEIENAVRSVKDLRETNAAKKAEELLNETPEEDEIDRAIAKMKESAPGKDGVRLCYVKESPPEIRTELVRMVKFMFENRAHKWEDELKTGQIIPLFKKGDKNDRNNYRGVCLLAMGSRILGKIMAERLRWWAEFMNLTDENQSGFRAGRSTTDATQMMVRLEEDTVDLRRRRRRIGGDEVATSDPMARLLDLKKAYPRVNKPALWGILERYGLKGNFLWTLQDLHEATTYSVKGRGEDSATWRPERGLREGCATSPTLFNIYHQAVMRRAEEVRKEEAEREGRQVGVKIKWQPGNTFPSSNLWEKYSSEAESRAITLSLFADDTTIVGRRDEIEHGTRIIKRIMEEFEEKNNEDKEEILEFGSEEGKKIRMLGSWIGPEEDVKNRKKRAGMLWFKVKNRLKNTKLSKKRQAKIFEACVENALLFDCGARTWYKKDIKKLQQWADKCVRYLWSRKTEPPLREMQRKGMNMQDVRNELEIKTIAWKIEKRVWMRMGHVFRMGEERLTKAVTLGWMEELEGLEKCPGRKRKTVKYWKKIVEEAGIDWMKVGELAADRDGWRKMMEERMEHLERYERSKGHMRTDDETERNIRRERTDEDLVCGWEGCGKRCKSRAGLRIHQKRMHEEARTNFTCGACGEVFKTENTMINHSKKCNGERADREGYKRCEKCGREVSKSNIARHRRACTAREGRGGVRGEVRPGGAPPEAETPMGGEPSSPGVQEQARVYRPKWKDCPICGERLSATNMARHMRRRHEEGGT